MKQYYVQISNYGNNHVTYEDWINAEDAKQALLIAMRDSKFKVYDDCVIAVFTGEE